MNYLLPLIICKCSWFLRILLIGLTPACVVSVLLEGQDVKFILNVFKRYFKNVEIFAIFKRYNERYTGYNGKKPNEFPSYILSQLNFIIGIFTLEPKFSDLYSDCINAFCLHSFVHRCNLVGGSRGEGLSCAHIIVKPILIKTLYRLHFNA